MNEELHGLGEIHLKLISLILSGARVLLWLYMTNSHLFLSNVSVYTVENLVNSSQ